MQEFGEDMPAAKMAQAVRERPKWFLLEHLEAQHAPGSIKKEIPAAFMGIRFSAPVGLVLCELAIRVAKMIPITGSKDTKTAIRDLKKVQKFWRGQIPENKIEDIIRSIRFHNPWNDGGGEWRSYYQQSPGISINLMDKIFPHISMATRIARDSPYYCYGSMRRTIHPTAMINRSIETIAGFSIIKKKLLQGDVSMQLEDHELSKQERMVTYEVLETILRVFKECIDDGLVIRYFATSIPD